MPAAADERRRRASARGRRTGSSARRARPIRAGSRARRRPWHRKAPTGVRLSATSSRQTGTTEWSRASSAEQPEVRQPPGRPASARRHLGPGASRSRSRRPGRRSGGESSSSSPVWQAPRPSWSTVIKQGVAVAVVSRRPHPLAIARGLALAPVLLAAAAPEPAAPVVRVRRSASASIQPSISTSPRRGVLHDRGARALSRRNGSRRCRSSVNSTGARVHRYSPVPSSSRSEATAGMSRSRKIR